MTLLLGRYDAAAVRTRLADAGVLRVLAERGFASLEVAIETVAGTLPHARLYGTKAGVRHLLLDAIVLETAVSPASFAKRGFTAERPMEILVVYWLREEDPTAAFTPGRPALPLQRHPGLGILRRAFAVVVGMARELGKDGVASVPKFFHDALIFYRSRLFLFFDAGEQGRFEALARDLAALPLGDASLALAGGCVRDAHDRVVCWQPGLLVLPLSARFAAYFNDPRYTAEAASACARSLFHYDPAAIARTRLAIGDVSGA
jgi:hypothetical protein